MYRLCFVLAFAAGLAAGPLAQKEPGRTVVRHANTAGPPDLDRRIRELLRASPAAERTFWGIEAVSMDSGERLFGLNTERYFMPASNTKLFTTALALMRLGPGHRFVTRLVADSSPNVDGTVRGSLTVVGGGDPTLSARAIPYRNGPATGNPLQAIDNLAQQAVSRGLRRVEGDIIGDDTAYPWKPYPEGWAVDDTIWDYGAPVSALAINDNLISLTLRTGRTGFLPVLFLSPAFEYYAIDNRVRTGPGLPADIRLDRSPGSRQLRISGTMPSGRPRDTTFLVAIDDPALYAAEVLRDALIQRGVSITGTARARHRFEGDVADLTRGEASWEHSPSVELATRISPPLYELLRVVDKVSQNLHAEIALREVGRMRRNLGTREAGLEEMKAFLVEVGITDTEYAFSDASGLSRLNLVTPGVVVRLLTYMHRSQYREMWLSLLPIGSEDGTLASRFDNRPAARRIHAKTGTLTHASALSGYAESRSRGVIAFSILANNYNVADSEIRAIIDKIGLLIAE
jgi:serine-type D-Ala-D-Ala carboxypeptidase/endopeptidase (penicillin-binding protein 4)